MTSTNYHIPSSLDVTIYYKYKLPSTNSQTPYSFDVITYKEIAKTYKNSKIMKDIQIHTFVKIYPKEYFIHFLFILGVKAWSQ